MPSSRSWLGAGGAVAVALLTLAGPERVAGQDHGGPGRHGGGGRAGDDVRALFARRCASCHVTPDPRVATDRAFIRQLQETA